MSRSNRTTVRRKGDKRGVEILDVLVMVNTPRHGDFGGTGFLKGHKGRDIQKLEEQALRRWKNNFSVGAMGTVGPNEKS